MSSEIIYGKQFVKLTDQLYVPMLLSGSSNCTEFNMSSGRTRRERHWGTWLFTKGLIMTTPTMIVKRIELMIKELVERYKDEETEEETLKNFGFHEAIRLRGGKNSAKDFIALGKNGIKGALTIEELHNMHIHLRFGFYDAYITNINPPLPRLPQITTNEEFFNQYGIVKEYIETAVGTDITDHKERKLSFFVDFDQYSADEVLKKIRHSKRKYPVRVEYQNTTVPHFYQLMDNDGRVLYKRKRWGYSYTTDKGVGKIFLNEKEAERYCNKYNGKLVEPKWQVIKVEQQREIAKKVKIYA